MGTYTQQLLALPSPATFCPFAFNCFPNEMQGGLPALRLNTACHFVFWLATAAFVGASNLGMALGPLLSLPLAYLPDRQVAGLSVNSITAVGWIMAFLWVLFFAATLIWFPDPPKRCRTVLCCAMLLCAVPKELACLTMSRWLTPDICVRKCINTIR